MITKWIETHRTLCGLGGGFGLTIISLLFLAAELSADSFNLAIVYFAAALVTAFGGFVCLVGAFVPDPQPEPKEQSFPMPLIFFIAFALLMCVGGAGA